MLNIGHFYPDVLPAGLPSIITAVLSSLLCFIVIWKKLQTTKAAALVALLVAFFGAFFAGGIATALIGLVATPSVMYINMMGTQEALTISGMVSELRWVDRGRRSGSYCAVTLEDAGKEILVLRYRSQSICYQYKRGDKVSINMTKGSLGYLYTTNGTSLSRVGK